MNQALMPTRIVTTCGNVLFPENLLVPKPQQAGFTDIGHTRIGQGGFVLLDFGREMRGGIVLTTCYPGSDDLIQSKLRARLVFGESVMEALSSIGYKNATNDHAIRDTVIDVPNMGNIRFGNTGFRFVKIEAIEGDLVLKAVRAESDIDERPYIGSFTCSDERLNDIWRTGAYTVALNTGEYVWDGVKRDRLVWLGDMHPETATIYAVYGADPSIRRSLDLIKNETPSTQWINTLPSYSFWWVILQCEHYMHTGDLAYLREQEAYMEVILQRGYEVVCQNPTPKEFDFFVDWSSNADRGVARVGFYAVLYKAFEAARHVAQTLRNDRLCALCENGKQRILALALPIPQQKQMAGIAAVAGIIDPKDANNTVLAVDPLAGLSTFMGYYVLLARAKAGDTQGALDIIRSYWGAMLDLGATTFWEDFDIDWCENAGRIDEIVPEGKVDVHGDRGRFCYQQFRHSLCHGWAGGPTAFLSEHVLGVHITEPGCRSLVIQPHLGDLAFARGTYPTPFGPVAIEHTREGDRIVTHVDAPQEVSVRIET